MKLRNFNRYDGFTKEEDNGNSFDYRTNLGYGYNSDGADEMNRLEEEKRKNGKATEFLFAFLSVICGIVSAKGPYDLRGVIGFVLGAAYVAFSYGKSYHKLTSPTEFESAGIVHYTGGNMLLLLVYLLSPVISAIMLFPYIPVWQFAAIVLGLVSVHLKTKNTSKTTVTVIGALIITVGAALYFVAQAFLSGGISPDSVKAQVIAPITAFRELLIQYSELASEQGMTDVQFDAEAFDALLSQLAMFVPAIVGTTSLIMSYISASLLSSLQRRRDTEKYIPNWGITLSVVSAVVFAASFIVVILASSTDASEAIIAGIAFDNLAAIIALGFMIVGLKDAYAFYRKTPFGVKHPVIAVIIAVLLFIYATSVAIYLFAAVGTVNTFKEAIDEKKKNTPEDFNG